MSKGPSVRQNSDHFMLHVGANDLDSGQSQELTAKSITDIAITFRSENHDVTISNRIPWNNYFQSKAKKVNAHLARLCKERNFSLIDHAKRIKPTHINRGKLHLNRYASNIFQDTFVQTFSKIIIWYDSEDNIENVDASSSPEKDYKSDSETTVNNVEYSVDLRLLHKKNLNKIIAAHLNINSLANELEFLIQKIEGDIDILMISEAKLDESFPVGQFLIKGFSTPFWWDRNCHGGGILLYIRKNIHSTLLYIEENGIEGFHTEESLKNKKKWLLNCSYNTP